MIFIIMALTIFMGIKKNKSKSQKILVLLSSSLIILMGIHGYTLNEQIKVDKVQINTLKSQNDTFLDIDSTKSEEMRQLNNKDIDSLDKKISKNTKKLHLNLFPISLFL